MYQRAFVVLWIAMLTAMVGISMVSPLLPIFVRDELGAPEFAVALSFSGISLTILVVAPFMGRLGDRFGPKLFIAGGFLLYAAGGLAFMASDTWEAVVAVRIFSGIGAAAFFPLGMAYVGRLAPPGREGEMMGVFAIAQVAGFGLGPLLGGVIRDAISIEAAFLTMTLLLGGTGLLVLFMLPPRPQRPGRALGEPEAPEPRTSTWRALHIPEVQAATLAQTMVSMGWGAGATYLTVYIVSAEGLDTGSAAFAGLLLAARSVIGGLLQPLFGRMADRFSRMALVIVGLVIAGVGQLVVPNVPHGIVQVGDDFVVIPTLLVLYTAIGVGEAIVWPAQQAIFVEAGRRVGMGAVMGLNQMGGSFGFLSGSMLSAAIVALFGLEASFRYAGIATLAGAVLFFLLMRRAGSAPAAPLGRIEDERRLARLGA